MPRACPSSLVSRLVVIVEKSSRERFLDTAAQLLQRQGYAATGLNEITAHSGAPKGSLYFHFPGGKEQLGAEALALAGARLGAGIGAIVTAAPDAPSAVRKLAAILGAGLEASGYESGCPIATTALETSVHSEALAAASHEAFAGWLSTLTDRFAADGVPVEQAQRDAVLVLSALEGALILARTSRSTEALMIVGEDLASYLSARMAR